MNHIYRLFLLVAFWFLFALPNRAFALTGPLFPLEYLKGVDKIVVTDRFGPKADKILSLDHSTLRPIVEQVVRSLFETSGVPVTVLSNNQTDFKALLDNEKAILLVVAISARLQPSSDGRIERIASITIEIQKPVDGFHAIPNSYVAYPLLASGKADDLRRDIETGVRYLTAHLPSYVSCANRRGSEICDLQPAYKEE